MKLPADFEDLLVCFVDSGVEFMIVGGYAVARHGHVRATKDIDVFIRPDAENAPRVIQALREFGAPLAALQITASDFSTPGNVVQLGVPPLRIDVITSISGLDYDAASSDPATIELAGRLVKVIGIDALLRNKRASGRPQDLADIAALEGTKR